MRKRFWCLTAVAIAVVGGMLWLKCQGPALPLMFTATAMFERCGHVPAAVAGATTARFFPLDSGAADIAGDEDLATFQKPEDPIEVADLKDPVPEAPLTGVVEFTPAPVVAAINIREPIDVAKPVAVAESGSWSGEHTIRPGTSEIDPAILQVNGVAVGLAHGEIQTVPRVMPYCQDDEVVAPKMPYAIDDDATDPDDDDDGDDNGDASIWSFFLPWVYKHTCNHGSAAPNPAGCCEDKHDQCPGCPASGRCVSPPKPYTEPKKETPSTAAPGGHEDSEPPPAKRKVDMPSLREQMQKLMRSGGCGPIFPNIDTMEFRPSDHSPYDHLPNPI